MFGLDPLFAFPFAAMIVTGAVLFIFFWRP